MTHCTTGMSDADYKRGIREAARNCCRECGAELLKPGGECGLCAEERELGLLDHSQEAA